MVLFTSNVWSCPLSLHLLTAQLSLHLGATGCSLVVINGHIIQMKTNDEQQQEVTVKLCSDHLAKWTLLDLERRLLLSCVFQKQLHLNRLQRLRPMTNDRVCSAPAWEEIHPPYHHQVAIVCIRHSKSDNRRLMTADVQSVFNSTPNNKATSYQEYVGWTVANGTGEEVSRTDEKHY